MTKKITATAKWTFKVALIFLLITTAWARENYGSLKGKVIDYKSGEPLIGANIMLAGTVFGAATDLDGNYYIYDILPGVYDIQVSYVGYDNQIIRGLRIQKGENHYLNTALISSVLNLSEIVVEVDASRNSDAYIISEKKRSSNLQDGVSSEQISRSGDSNAADAVKRITGVSVLEGNNVYVRGLGDRYVSTQMNGVPIPSPEPEKKSVPLNLFSTGILESITAYKTFTPDLPGVFGGGTVDIKTKAYPDHRIFNLSAGITGSTDFIGSNFRKGSKGSLDFLGFDDGIRALPSIIPDNKILSKYTGPDILSTYHNLGEYGRAFKSDMTSSEFSGMVPFSLGINAGNKYTGSEKLEYGYYSNINFSNDYSYRDDVYRKYSVADEKIITRTDLKNEKSSYKTNMSLSGSAGLKLYNNHTLKISTLYTHMSESSFNYGFGKTPNLDENGIYLKEYYVEKSLLNTTLTGLHNVSRLHNSRLEWTMNAGVSRLSEPDIKSHNYKYYGNENLYRLASSSAKAGLREFTDGFDVNGNIDVNYQVNIKDRAGETYKIKTGGRIQGKFRTFSKRSFYHEYSNGSWPEELITIRDFSSLDAFGSVFQPQNFFSYDPVSQEISEGLILLESTDGASRNAYDARELNNAVFGMFDIPLGFGRVSRMNKFRFISGLRIEDYSIILKPYNSVTKDPYVSGLLDGRKIETKKHQTDFLPSINLIYNMSDFEKIRLSYSNTVARAEFREMAPFEFQAFYGGNLVVGYPYLKTTRINNYDIRYERYRLAGELFSAGLFFKDFSNPIEKVIIETADESYITFQNALYAYTFGIEFDYRTSLMFIPLEHGKLMFVFNATLSQSEVRSPESIILFTGASTPNNAGSLKRPLQGQSDIMLNTSLNYHGLNGLNVSVSYNVFSKRLNALGTGTVPDEYELPFHSLNLTLSKAYNNLKISFKAKNILNQDVQTGFKENGKTYLTNRYHPGMGAGIGVTYAF